MEFDDLYPVVDEEFEDHDTAVTELLRAHGYEEDGWES